jgi:DNA-binding helix-hairpin-helix protein with protein kinase domain
MDLGSVVDVAGRPMSVATLLGTGGEGAVYELVGSGEKLPLALKWFHPAAATPQRRAEIQSLVRYGPPSKHFLWPSAVIEEHGSPDGRFGYVMALRPDGFVRVADLLRARVARREDAVVRFAFELAMAFRSLHLRGLCYRDINFGNVFMDPVSGRALVCDNDNVGVEGASAARVLGVRRFMAPEVVRGEALPSKVTDRHSLSVMLFYLLLVHHPLEGVMTEQGLVDAEAELTHYGLDPVFCFDPSDDRNRPDATLHAHVPRMWAALPVSVRRLFERSFTEGLNDPARRVVDGEWCTTLAEMLGQLFHCPTCSGVGFLDDGTLPRLCGSCGAELGGSQLLLEVGTSRAVLRPGTSITSHQLHHDLEVDEIVGIVERHPSRPELMGLRNDTARPWTVKAADGVGRPVLPGQRAGLFDGVHITFDGKAGRVRRV